MAKSKGILLGLAHSDGHTRITRSDDFVLFGGSKETHEVMQDTAIRVNEELKRRGKNLGDVGPKEFFEILEKASQ
jgi:hypothetical protein